MPNQRPIRGFFSSRARRDNREEVQLDEEAAVNTNNPKPNEDVFDDEERSKTDYYNEEETSDNEEIEPNTDEVEPKEETTLNEEDGSVDGDEESSETTDFDKIVRHLQTEDWTFSVKRERGVVITNATGDNGSYRIIIDLKEDEHILIIYVYLPCKAPPEKRLPVAEYITRANYGLVIGNFELDFQDGEVRYKGALEYADGELTNKMIEQLLQKCAYTMNRYFPGLMRVIYGDMEALDVIREIEPDQAGGAALALARLVEALAIGNDGSDLTDGSSQAIVVSPAESSHSEDSMEAIVATPAEE